MRNINIIALILLTLSPSVFAKDKHELVLDMFKITQAEKNHQLMIESYIKQLSSNPLTATEKFEEYFREATSWDSLVGPMINIYEETYTEEELKSMNQFFSSEIGQSFIEKSPQINEKTSAVIMQNIYGAMKHLQPQK